MEFCPRCNGGEIYAPNCPACGGSGLISQVTTPIAPARVLCVSPEVRKKRIEVAREAREAEKKRKVRTGSRQPTGTELALSALSPQERREREKWLRKYQARQGKRLRDEARRRKMTPEQLAAEDQRRSERAYLQRLNRMQKADTGSRASATPRGGLKAGEGEAAPREAPDQGGGLCPGGHQRPTQITARVTAQGVWYPARGSPA